MIHYVDSKNLRPAHIQLVEHQHNIGSISLEFIVYWLLTCLFAVLVFFDIILNHGRWGMDFKTIEVHPIDSWSAR